MHRKDKKITVFYVNPMGYGNLGAYDYSLIKNLKLNKFYYFGNIKNIYEIPKNNSQTIFKYSDKKGIVKFFSYLHSLWLLFKAIRKKSPDLIHFQWLKAPFLDFFLIRLIQKFNIKLVLTAHNILPHDSGVSYRVIYKKIYNALDAIIVHSSLTKEELVHVFKINPAKIHVIPHGILNISRSKMEVLHEQKNNLTKTYKLDNKIVFSVLGGINKYKGIELIINSWQKLELSHNSRMHLIIAGDDKKNYTKTLSKDLNTTIINRFLSDDEFIGLLQISDFVLLPYLRISQSGVLLTALNEKKRVIVSNKGGLTEPFQFGKIGYIIEEPSPEKLSKVLMLAFKEKDVYPSKDTWDAIFEYYNWKNIGNKTNDLYVNIVSNSIF